LEFEISLTEEAPEKMKEKLINQLIYEDILEDLSVFENFDSIFSSL
jgi:hypothetical protein